VSVQAIGWIFDHENTTTGTARLVLLSLANHAGSTPNEGGWESWPSIATIAREANVARVRTVQDILSRLERDGLIVRVMNGAPDARLRGNRRPNLYRIVVAGVSQNVIPDDDLGVTRSDARGVALRQVGVSLSDAKDELALISLEPSLEPSEEPRVVFGFDAFWIAYPRRVAKRAAQLAWKKAITRAEPEQIIAGAARFLVDPNRDPTFTPHPASWLNDDRWLDEALPPRRTTTKNAASLDRRVATDRSLPSGRITL
jgi:hypothetical protein